MASIDLVQDPFGNYVVQYILDLNEQKYTHPLCINFFGKVSELSRQKFSSNVVEKCIRVAAGEVKKNLIDELLQPGELEQAMRDPYANYVIQTALDYADNDTCLTLIDNIRPIIPSIRQTPYGRRIQTKIQEREARLAQGSGPALIDASSLATSPIASPHYTQAIPYTQEMQAPNSNYASNSNGYTNPIASPQAHRLSNPLLSNHMQPSVQQQHSPQQQQPQQSANYGRAPPPPFGLNYF